MNKEILKLMNDLSNALRAFMVDHVIEDHCEMDCKLCIRAIKIVAKHEIMKEKRGEENG